ncbi:type II toxin-antitoxin system RelE/ParE family toxin [Candidatus Oleimmundimicrobium sp.]|uniref:type II toxin-antitoxin system RelE/ParE family toxin n=1 Tax=Candidatus Oleimmundimicrobium sp. TaxID=3060597 RepID=UPI00271E3C43|nr:type II toxin-antitoxin system RelE/ParE family toxin [Candidatus Oleimmundimicrobium sp.]MDO8885488.1 type II toxin-antitoxin system RelE/ParE family toxin [Candidatus Oleimmundimicrobium sp.]
MKEIIFYKTRAEKSPVEDFLDTLSGKQAQKVTWVLSLIEELGSIPSTYMKHLVNTNEIIEIRVQLGRDVFRLLGFLYNKHYVVLINGFQKKTQKTPKQEIVLAEQRKCEYLRRRKSK